MSNEAEIKTMVYGPWTMKYRFIHHNTNFTLDSLLFRTKWFRTNLNHLLIYMERILSQKLLFII